MKKAVITAVALTLALCLAVGGTLAYLMDKTQAVTNTFTAGDVDIKLEETTGPSYKMVPGNAIAKDPKITVLADSEACWLFVKVEKANDVEKFLSYDIVGAGWTELNGETGVYYREVDDTDADQKFSVLNGDKVTVKTSVTKGDMDALTDATQPKLTFTAYAVQKANVADVTTAWGYAQSAVVGGVQ